MSTLRVSLRRDVLGLVLKASALELVTVGSKWIRSGAPVGKQGPFKVLTIDHRVEQNMPWLTVEDGWCGRLDYFHRDYTRYPEQVSEMPKPGSYWRLNSDNQVRPWRCVSATSRPVSDVHMTAAGDGDYWQGTVAEFNRSFRRSAD